MGTQNSMGGAKENDREGPLSQERPNKDEAESVEGVAELPSPFESENENNSQPTMNQTPSTESEQQSVMGIFSKLMSENPQLSALTGTEIQSIRAQLVGKTVETLSDIDLDLLESYGISGEIVSSVVELLNQTSSKDFSPGTMGPGERGTMSVNNEDSQLGIALISLVVMLFGIGIVTTFKNANIPVNRILKRE